MFDNFFRFTGYTPSKEITNEQEFIESLGGITFLNGMYRIFCKNETEKWLKITEQAFSAYNGSITVFAYDWLGRIFAVKNSTKTILLFEPGTGEVLDIPASFVDFHNIEIAEYHEDSLASEFFECWQKTTNNYILKHNECAGYKIPLFLNGNDTVDNLEVSDMEVYWEIMMPLMNL